MNNSANPQMRKDSDSVVDAVVVGAGFAGLYMLYKLRSLNMSLRVFEAGDGVGGTWYWNRYPGARCDAESVLYSYSFSDELDQEWTWSERFATQPEILRYLNYVAERFDLRKDISFETRVTSARYCGEENLWEVETDRGERFRCRFLITGVGCLSASRLPDIPGLDEFKGRTLHTARWPHERISFEGERVGVIGTGSSGIQLIPQVAAQAAHLTVFQRTANFSVPAHNRPLGPDLVDSIKKDYASLRELSRLGFVMSGGGTLLTPEQRKPAAACASDLPEQARRQALQGRWDIGGGFLMATFLDIMTDADSNRQAADFVRTKIRSIVDDTEVAELLCPNDHPLGSKRLCVDTGYYSTYNRPNVSLVDIRSDPIERIIADGILTRSGERYVLDTLVFATGFDAITGPLLRLNITGTGGKPLSSHWEDGPRTYLGLAMAGFPNLFTITGPLSPSVLSNVVVSIEQHVEWIHDCLAHMREHGFDRIEAEPQSEDWWVGHVRDLADSTLFSKGNSWFNGANVPGKPRVFLAYVSGVGPYREICGQVRDENYKGFVLSKAGVASAARPDIARILGRDVASNDDNVAEARASASPLDGGRGERQ